MSDLKLRCTSCDRYLKINPKSTTICVVTCSDRKCKKDNNIKVIFSDASEQQIKYKFKEETNGN